MSERSVIAPENIPTVVAVAAITALLSLAFTIFVYNELKAVTIGAVELDVRAARRDVELERRIKALDARLAELEAPAAADATPSPTTPAPGAVLGAGAGAGAAVPDAATKPPAAPE